MSLNGESLGVTGYGMWLDFAAHSGRNTQNFSYACRYNGLHKLQCEDSASAIKAYECLTSEGGATVMDPWFDLEDCESPDVWGDNSKCTVTKPAGGGCGECSAGIKSIFVAAIVTLIATMF